MPRKLSQRGQGKFGDMVGPAFDVGEVEFQLRVEPDEHRPGMMIMQTLGENTVGAQLHLGWLCPRPEQLPNDRGQQPEERTERLVDQDVERMRGFGHLAFHQLAEPGGAALGEASQHKGVDKGTQRHQPRGSAVLMKHGLLTRMPKL